MNKIDPLEKQLQSWIPRPPSAKIATGLFSHRTESVGVLELLNGPALWRCLTPGAACLLTILAVINGGPRRVPGMPVADNSTYYATVMMDVAHSSNAPHQTFALTKVDVNLEWNVWGCVRSAPGSASIPITEPLPVAITNRVD